MPDYVLKSELLRDGTVSEVKQIQKAFFKKFTGREISDEEYDEALRRAECIDFDDFNEATRILSAQHSRTKRLRSRIEDMLESFDDCTFVTLTFTDEVLKRTSSATRRRYVAYFLKSQSSGLPYVANIDFGAQNGREHYHAVCAFRITPATWLYGILNFEKIRSAGDSLKLSKYVSKLTNHAIKETCKRNAMIYSRDVSSKKSASNAGCGDAPALES